VHPNVERVVAALREAGASGEVRDLDGAARTAQAAAVQIGCDVGAIANSLVFDADGEPLLILTSGRHRVDPERVAAAIGIAGLKRADPDFVRGHTGFPIGGVAPVGHPERLRTLVDVALREYPEIWAAAGHPHTVFRTTFDELVRITSGTPAEVGD
jgi:prolyl-tRNA editing enzyme YbaK/EbsC (Cys-tRNA(Pro) deacylase)